MHTVSQQLAFKIHEGLFLKNPDSSDLGRIIVRSGLKLMSELGFEQFTFRKLSIEVGSPESTIYRYFENKHKFLLYLLSLYWSWLEYRIVVAITNIDSAEERMRRAIRVLVSNHDPNFVLDDLDMKALTSVAVAESTKAILTKMVDEENKMGFFSVYQRLVKRVSDIAKELNPHFIFGKTLVSTIIESAHLQRFYAAHLPSICDFEQDEFDERFFEELALKVILHYEN